MQNLRQLWSSFDLRRRVIIAGATLAMFVTIIAISRVASSPSMALLYSGLDPAVAGSVLAELEARGVESDIRGGAIFVPEDERDSLRLLLAAEGIPAQGGAGYELLDTLDGFGTTTQMFDAAWGRAIEGELARTILANPQIRSARVHIARGSDRPFAPPTDPSASVALTTVGGVSAEQARALRHLVAAAVTGLRPDRVEIIDSASGLVPVDGSGASSAATAERAAQVRGNVERLLAARVGPGRAVVEVSVELVTESELLTERRLDPQGRVAIMTENSTSSGSETQVGGSVTVASNLPDGEAADGADQRNQTQENSERATFEVSETRREVTRQPGDIRRMTVAVIVDGRMVTGEDGTESWQPRDEEELATLRELVLAAAGIDEGRGDVLTLKSLEFVPMGELGTEGTPGWSFDATRLAGVGLLVAALLALGFFVLRPALRSANATAAAPQLLPLGPVEPDVSGRSPVLSGEIQDEISLPTFARTITAKDPEDVVEEPVARLRRLITERQDESIEILRNWMDAEGGRT